MIYGRFGNTTGRPYLEARISIVRLGLSANVSFIVDTGADATVLMPLDGVRMGIPYGSLINPKQSLGVGGYANDFQETAHVAVFDADGFLVTYKVNLTVASQTVTNANIPSLLGRDIINCWTLTADKPHGLLMAEPISWLDRRPATAAPVPSGILVQ